MKNNIGIMAFIGLCLTALSSYAQPDIDDNNGFGQTIQITTYLSSFVGNPMWLLMIRDLDHNQNIPYLFDISKGNNFWVPLTYGNNYLITASNLQIESFKSRYNSYGNYRIRDFCHMESNGRIQRGESMYVTITGNITPNSNTYSCQISKVKNANFIVVDP